MTSKADGELILLWTLPVLGLIWISAFLLFPGFVHPLSPTMSADEVAAFYRDPENLARIRYSMILFNWFGVALVPTGDGCRAGPVPILALAGGEDWEVVKRL